MAIAVRSDEDSIIGQLFGSQQGVVESNVRDYQRRKQSQAIQQNLLKEMMMKRPELFQGASASVDPYGKIEGNTSFNRAFARPETDLSIHGRGNLQTASAISKKDEAIALLNEAYEKKKLYNKESDARVKNIYNMAINKHSDLFNSIFSQSNSNSTEQLKDILTYKDMLLTDNDLPKLMTTTDRLAYMSNQLPEEKVNAYKEQLKQRLETQNLNQTLGQGIGLNSDIPLGGTENTVQQAPGFNKQSTNAKAGSSQGVDFKIGYDNSPENVNIGTEDQVTTRTILDPSVRDEIRTDYGDLTLLADLHDASMAFDDRYNQSLNPYRRAAADRLEFLKLYDEIRNKASDITVITPGKASASIEGGVDKIDYQSGQDSSQNVTIGDVKASGGSTGGGGKIDVNYLEGKGFNQNDYQIAYNNATQRVITDQSNIYPAAGTSLASLIQLVGNNKDMGYVAKEAQKIFGDKRVKIYGDRIEFVDPASGNSQKMYLYFDGATDTWQLYVQAGAIQSNVASLLGSGTGNVNRANPEKNKEKTILDYIFGK